MTFLPLKSVVSAFQASLAGSSDVSCGFAVADLKVELPAEVAVVGGEVMIQLASSAEPVNPAYLTKVTITLGATCTPETMEPPAPAPSPWTPVLPTTGEYFQGAFSDATSSWVVGLNGAVLTSKDGALTFSPVDVGTPVSFAAVTKLKDIVVAVGELGTARVRDPGSGAWSPSTVQSAEYILGLTTVGNFFVAVGGVGNILLSADQGQHFDFIGSFSQEDLNAIAAAPDGTLWAAGGLGTVLFSTDIKTWKSLEVLGSQHWYSLSVAPSGRVFVAGEGGRMAVYTPAGGKYVESGTGKHLYAVHALETGAVLAVGAGGTAIWSKDGTTFTALSPPTTESLHAISSLGAGKLLVVGEGGTILRLDTTLL